MIWACLSTLMNRWAFRKIAFFGKAGRSCGGQLDLSFDDGRDRANALCTSQPQTLQFVEEGCRVLFQAVPDLAGAIVISASEHLTHCYSHESKYRSRGLVGCLPIELSKVRCAQTLGGRWRSGRGH